MGRGHLPGLVAVLVAVLRAAHTVRAMTTQLDFGFAPAPGPLCSVAGCAAHAVICRSCLNTLLWPGVLRQWSGVPRVCSALTCRLCQSPEYEPFLCRRHVTARLTDAFA